MLLFLFIIIAKLANQTESDSYENALDYKNNIGIQIYMTKDENVFSYMSVDSSSIDIVKATLYLYTTIDVSKLDYGMYIAIGTGSIYMFGSEILLCAVRKDYSTFCHDYIGDNHTIADNSVITTLKSSTWEKVSSTFSPHQFKCSWVVERLLDAKDLIDGTVHMIYAFGYLENANTPMKHDQLKGSSKTGDGNKGLGFFSPNLKDNQSNYISNKILIMFSCSILFLL